MYLPNQVLHNDQGSSYVWSVNSSNRAVKTSVEIGIETSDGLVEILSGLNPTDKVISGDTDKLVDQQSVTIRWDTSETALVRN